jgi:hypothetical protein
MKELLDVHQLSLATRKIVGLDGLAFGLVLVHAVHVLGGMVLLTTLSVRSDIRPFQPAAPVLRAQRRDLLALPGGCVAGAAAVLPPVHMM